MPWLMAQGTLPPEMSDASYDRLYDRLASRTEDMGITTIDLRSSFRKAAKRGSKLYWSVDGHLTPLGHRLTATVLAQMVAEGRHTERSHASQIPRP